MCVCVCVCRERKSLSFTLTFVYIKHSEVLQCYITHSWLVPVVLDVYSGQAERRLLVGWGFARHVAVDRQSSPSTPRWDSHFTLRTRSGQVSESDQLIYCINNRRFLHVACPYRTDVYTAQTLLWFKVYEAFKSGIYDSYFSRR